VVAELVLNEYLIETDEEASKVTQMYISHANRLKEAKKAVDDDEDEMKEALENAFISLQFGNAKKQNADNEKRAAKLFAKYNEEEANSSEDEDETVKKTAEMEEMALEEFIQMNHNNYSKIDEHYKLFEVVSSDNSS